ncbi:MAG TPA: oxygenase MpaB family protein, partial [Puia sp.]|nr:oxygenase MpaB family protein [Puia sp.]
ARRPATAYLDVLFMLIGYSIASFELLERPLRAEEREEVFDVFKRVGDRMGLVDLPATFPEWQARRTQYLQTNLEYSKFSRDLYRSYRRNLGWLRYQVLIQTQVLLVPGPVRRMLGFSSIPWLYPVVLGYRFSRFLHLDKAIKVLLLPPQYRAQAFGLDH